MTLNITPPKSFSHTFLHPFALLCSALIATILIAYHYTSIADGLPAQCYPYKYDKAHAEECWSKYKIEVYGDSTARAMYAAMDRLSGGDGAAKVHADLHSPGKAITFHWDPYLNGTVLESISEDWGIIVLKAGYWDMKVDPANGYRHFTNSLLALREAAQKNTQAKIYISLLHPVQEQLLKPTRENITQQWVNSYNLQIFNIFDKETKVTILQDSFNLYKESQQLNLDGLHYADTVANTELNILLNHACNDALQINEPLPKTTCNAGYSLLDHKAIFLLAIFLLLGPVLLSLNKLLVRVGISVFTLPIPAITTIFVAVFYCILSDRTSIFLKTTKIWNPYVFAIGMGLTLIAGMSTLTKGSKGFLNRDQTDEWKGWMQIVILIYHYVGGSSIVPIYNSIRLLVASYLFMTGYGHFTFFYKKKDFSLHRSLGVLVRLNLLTVALCLTTGLDYLTYYFAPLVSLWYLFIYTTMYISRNISDARILAANIVFMTVLMAYITQTNGPMSKLVELVNAICQLHWNAREWSFRTSLDVCIVPAGMLTALVYTKYNDFDFDRLPFKLGSSALIGLVALVLSVCYGIFHFHFQDKLHYNRFHPYTAWIPVLLFVALRNLTSGARQTYSRFYAWIGQCSLETFILQYHIWLAMDTRGILVVLPGKQWIVYGINLILTTSVFLWMSESVAAATTELTGVIVGAKGQRKWYHVLLVLIVLGLWNRV